jgi:hypothetical protein
MVPSTTEITEALHGTIRLARLDATGLRYFDRTVDGFWRSFFAAVMIAPAHIMLLLLTRRVPEGASGLRVAAIELIAYAIGWLAFPCAMLLVADLLKRRARYFDYMVAYNWCNVPQIGLLLFVTGLGAAGVLPGLLGLFVVRIALVSILIYQWFIARVGLSISATAAVALVLLDFVIGQLTDLVTQYLLRT